jgi:hypothetical protein
MDTNSKVLGFLRKLVLSDYDAFDSLKSEALDILLENAASPPGRVLKYNGFTIATIKDVDHSKIQQFMDAGQKIQAIKHLRTIANLGLLEAKQIVENSANFEQEKYLNQLHN